MYFPGIGFQKTLSRIRSNYNTRRKIKKILSKPSAINLEIGAGNKKGENGWTTLDMNKNCDLQWNLEKGIPFPENSVSKIYSSHLFEHLAFKDIQKLLKESLRVLKKDGIFLISVPNSRLYIESYLNETNFWNSIPAIYKPAFNNTTRIDYINYIAYMDGHHKYMFDEENLLYILREAGFRDVKLRNFDPEIDLKERDFESIYAKGIK